MSYSIVITTTDDKAIADKLVDVLIKKNLAACVQIEKIKSYYMWKNNLTNSDEYRLTIKTKSNLYSNIEKEILAIHNYDLPEIIELNIDGGYSPYLEWIKNFDDKNRQ